MGTSDTPTYHLGQHGRYHGDTYGQWVMVLLIPQPGDLQETTVRHCEIRQEARHACAGKRRDETASRQVTPALVSSARPFRHNINRLPQPGQDPHATERRLETSPRGDPTLQITRGQSSRKMTEAERQRYNDPERLIQWDVRPWCCNGVQCTPRGVCARRMTQNIQSHHR
jgi:hypothetical protein